MNLALVMKCLLDVHGGGGISLLLSLFLFVTPMKKDDRLVIVKHLIRFLIFSVFLSTISLLIGVSYFSVFKGVTKYMLIYFFFVWGNLGMNISKAWIRNIVLVELMFVALQYLLDFGIFSYHVTPNGTFTSSNNLAAFILLFTLIYYSNSWVYIGAIIISSVLLDSMIISASFALGFLAKRRFFSLKNIGLGLLLSSIGLIFFERFSSQLQLIQSQDWNLILDNKARGMGSGVWRLWAWFEYFQIWTMDWISFLFGTGFQSTNKMSPDFIGAVVGQDPHNSYLSIFVEHGLIFGILLFVWLFRGFNFSNGTERAIFVFVLFASIGTNIIVSVPFMLLLAYYKGNREYVRNISLQ